MTESASFADQPAAPEAQAQAEDSAESDAIAASPAKESPAGTVPEQDTQEHLPPDYEPLTAAYERLRHSSDSRELSEFARRPLPDKSDQAAFSRATALLEAVAGNAHTPVEDRIMLAETMPFPNVLVKLSEDSDENVRAAVAGNTDDKNWLVGRLTKDESLAVRKIALRNKRTSWKMRLEGAQSEQTDAETLDFLSRLGVDSETDASPILSSMVRRAVSLNPNTGEDTLARLAADPDPVVAKAASGRRSIGA